LVVFDGLRVIGIAGIMWGHLNMRSFLTTPKNYQDYFPFFT